MNEPLHPTLARVAAHLPFHLNETERVNVAYRRWRQHADAEARYVVDLWTYCYVRRYFLFKAARETAFASPADMDVLIEEAFLKIQEKMETVSDTTRFASWVSVVCKYTYLNYRRAQIVTVPVDQDGGPDPATEAPNVLHDPGFAREAVRHAIDRLPAFLQDVARLRFLEGRTYADIGRRTGKPLPSIRTYVNKALVKIRSDREFLEAVGHGEGDSGRKSGERGYV